MSEDESLTKISLNQSNVSNPAYSFIISSIPNNITQNNNNNGTRIQEDIRKQIKSEQKNVRLRNVDEHRFVKSGDNRNRRKNNFINDKFKSNVTVHNYNKKLNFRKSDKYSNIINDKINESDKSGRQIDPSNDFHQHNIIYPQLIHGRTKRSISSSRDKVCNLTIFFVEPELIIPVNT